MTKKVLIVAFVQLIVFFLKFAKVYTEDVIYVPNFVSVEDCDDFKNEEYMMKDISLSIDSSSADEVGIGLCGVLDINVEIGDTFDITLAVSKRTETDKEYMFESRGNICGSMKNDDAPWKPLLETMGVSQCPIPTGSYPIADLKLSLNSFKDVLSRDFCGEYEVSLCILVNMDKKACFVIGLDVVEYSLE